MHMPRFGRLALSIVPLLFASEAYAELKIKSVLVAENLANPVFLTAPPGDYQRAFIVEQAGTIRILASGEVLPVPFLDLTEKVLTGGERGLLGLAFHPDYAANGEFFVFYTRQPDGALTVERYAVSADPDAADFGSGTAVISIPHPTFGNHNGGMISFGPSDGYLYIGAGDGGGGGDPAGNAQNLGSLLGKILRIDVDWAPYTIPPDNPFVDGNPATRDEIWAWGLRNPWRFSFDPVNGDLYIGDVGQNAWEEIDWAPGTSPGGENYGWRCYEGNHPYNLDGCGPAAQYVFPVTEYPHPEGESVTGGYPYRGGRLPGLEGTYFYGDFVTSFLRSLEIVSGVPQNQRDRTEELDPAAGSGRHINSPSSFGLDGLGELYACDYDGEVFKIAWAEAAVERGDYDGDGSSDFAVFRRGDNLWAIRNVSRIYFGAASDLPVPADYNGDGTAEAAVFRAANALWAVRGTTRITFGSTWDFPLIADYTGDRRAEPTAFREATGLWSIHGLTRFFLGTLGDWALSGDYNGDGTGDAALFRPRDGSWAVRGLTRLSFGGSGDIPLPGDYDGDGTFETGLYRRAEGMWAIRGVTRAWLGGPWDRPLPADYSGDGTDDIGLFREWTGLWAVAGFTRAYFGNLGDLTVTR